jgi:two-component system response regulator MprA
MCRILIVDDDLETRTLLSRVLAAEGLAVETAPDGRVALEMVTASPPDLLITDLIMPRLSGWSLFARVRRLAPMLPIILISGSDPGLRHRGQSLPGHVAFLRKPFALDLLLATVTRLLTEVWFEHDPMLKWNAEDGQMGSC